MHQPPKPTDSELEILQILWQQGAATVREVNETLAQAQDKEPGYTTTLKLMQIMYEKGLVSREKQGKTHLYCAAIGEQNTQAQLLDRFIDKVFRGSPSQLVQQMLGRKSPSAKELQEIRKILENLEKNTSDDDTRNLD